MRRRSKVPLFFEVLVNRKLPKKLSVILSIIAILFLVIQYKEFKGKSNIEVCEEYKNKEIKGVVLSRDKSIGAVDMLSTGVSFIRECTNEIGVNVGDSVYKPAGTYSHYIYRNCNPDSVVFIDCNYKCEYIEMYSEKIPEVEYKMNKNSISLNWTFSRRIEKYLTKIVLIKKIPDNYSLNDTIVLAPNKRTFTDSNLKGQKEMIYKLMFYYVNNDVGEGNMTLVRIKE